MFFSVIIPTYSRPDEITELLNSLVNQQSNCFEVIIADGSMDHSVKQAIDPFYGKLQLKYLYQRGLGISDSRNWGAENAKGDFLVFFDSDCIIPPQYFKVVNELLAHNELDAYGGPDKAGEDFSKKQKAISYAMTSFFTTGGIRGKKRHAGRYQPRSFNMGIRKSVFHSIGGFSGLKVSEDIDLSIRLYKNKFNTGLIQEAFVYHKRRSTFYKFFRQVMSFGSGRIDLQIKHGDALKPVHVLPSLFIAYIFGGIISVFLSKTIFTIWLYSFIVYMLAILIDSSLQNHNLWIGFLSVYAAFIMLSGYGLGMIKAFIKRYLMRSGIESEKPEITKEA